MWGPILFATLVPVGAFILGGLVHVVFRQGRTEQRVRGVEDDVRDIKGDLQWWIRRVTGTKGPSERREEE